MTYRRLREPFRRLAYVLVNDAGAAEEIVQDAFVRFFRHRQRVTSPDAFLRATVINGCRNHYRWVAVRRRFVAMGAESPPAPDHLVDAIACLPYRQRAVVVLRYYEALPEREIADALQMPIGTVKSTLHRVLAQLRRSIDDH